MLGHDCLKTLRKISKALLKVNLEDRAMMENGKQWNIIFLKTTHTHTHTHTHKTTSGWQDFAIDLKFSLCFTDEYILCFKLYF